MAALTYFPVLFIIEKKLYTNNEQFENDRPVRME